MQIAIIPILLFGVVAILVAGAIIGAGYLLNPRRSSRVKEMPYESGMDPIHDTRRRFDIRFHLLAIAFLVFDVELLFLYPWAVAGHRDPTPTPAPTQVAEMREEKTSYEALRKGGGRPLLSLSGSNASFFAGQKEPVPFSPPITSFDAAVDAGWIEHRGIIFGGVMFFIALVTLGFVYDWRKGIFHWR